SAATNWRSLMPRQVPGSRSPLPPLPPAQADPQGRKPLNTEFRRDPRGNGPGGRLLLYSKGMTMPPSPVRLSELVQRTPEQPISHFMELALVDPNLISLAAGFVDEESLPAASVAEAVGDLMARPETARAALQSGS